MNTIKNTGFSLLEALIATVIVSIALLGIAALQLNTQKVNRQSLFHTRAILASHDILERMRANETGTLAGDYNNIEAEEIRSCYTTAGCSASQMAKNDLYEWGGDSPNSIVAGLAGGSGKVCIDSIPDDGTPTAPKCDGIGVVYAIKVWWRDSNADVQRIITTAAFK